MNHNTNSRATSYAICTSRSNNHRMSGLNTPSCMISDPRVKKLVQAATTRQRQAHRPGTSAGRASVVRGFLKFCKLAKTSHKRLGYFHICWYIEHLVEEGLTSGTISNHISHLRTFYKLSGIPDAPLYHYRVSRALRAVAMAVRKPSMSKLDVPPHILRKALACNIGRSEQEATTLAFIIMYVGFLRQSSIAPPTKQQYDPTRHPTRQDIRRVGHDLSLNVKWTKTLQRAGDAQTIRLSATKDPALCPVKALARYELVRPNPAPAEPLLTYTDGNPITTGLLARRW